MLQTLLLAALLATPAPAPVPAPLSVPTPAATPLTPERVLGLIRATYRAHRPPPPYVTYTMVRAQKTYQGYPDYVGSYTYHIYCRTSDRACLARRVYRDTYRGDPEFQRPAFNEDRDPGPPTADLFEPAPVKPHPVEFVPTPEATQETLRELGAVRALGEFDYRVTSFQNVAGTLHLTLEPTRDPLRNRLRELWADAKTYELSKVIAADRLFDETRIYSAVFTITLVQLQGFPVVTDIHAVVGDGYDDDGKVSDFTFKDITFPTSLPEWYFDAHASAGISPRCRNKRARNTRPGDGITRSTRSGPSSVPLRSRR